MPAPEAASASSTYDLVLLLDTEAQREARAGVLGDVKRSIASDGELLRHDEWGNRELAYPIGHRQQAEYHLLQFRPSEAQLLRVLERSLRIADEVLRFRIVKLRPGTPPPPDMRAGQTTGSGHGSARPAPSERAAGPEADLAAESGSTPGSEGERSAAAESTQAGDAAATDAAGETTAGSGTTAASQTDAPTATESA
jgi:small subunit ribosomal protein S6